MVCFDCVHTDDLINRRRSAYHNVDLVSIDQKRVEARALSLTQETIQRRKDYASRAGAGKEAS